MKDILNKLLSLFGNTLSMRLNSNHNSNKIKGDGNFVNQASRDINLFNLSVYREGDKNNLSRVEAEIGTILNELQRDINADDLNDALSNYSNYRALLLAAMQILTDSNDVERREMLRKLLLDKFNNKNEDERIYLQAIADLEKLSGRDLRVLACMYFIMTLSIHLHESTLVNHKKNLMSLINEVGILKENEVEKLSCHGFLYKLFPQKYDRMGLERLKNFDEDLYHCCMQWVINNEFICGFKVSSLSKLLVRVMFSVVYDLNFEDVNIDELSLRAADLTIGNLIAKGDVSAS